MLEQISSMKKTGGYWGDVKISYQIAIDVFSFRNCSLYSVAFSFENSCHILKLRFSVA